MKKLILTGLIILILIILGKNLNPFFSQFFTFHDETQPGRVHQFVKELKSFHFPPRVAPDMNFGVGYPIFNFYAPTAYWITGLVHLLGVNIINSLKISFLLSLAFGFLGMYLFLTIFFDFLPSMLGGIFYITSLYFPLNIFVRGNLAETWFLALFPFSMFFIIKTAKIKKIDKKFFLTNIILLSLLLTSHNIFSLLSIFLIIVIIFITKNSFRINLTALFFAIFLSSYFWFPAILEMKDTWAKEVAEKTKYSDHFLCPNQLWQSDWGYGGSTVGCQNDGMSFKIGKLQLIFFFLGITLFLIKILRSKKIKDEKISLVIMISSGLFLFLTTYQSYFIWKIFEPILKIVQFPWRFIGLSIFGISYSSSYFFDKIKIPLKNIIILFFIFLSLFINQKYFVGQKITNQEFEEKYLSKNYIKNKVAFKVAEYLPKSNDYNYWRSLENKNPEENEIRKLTLAPFNKNKQTTIEKLANLISILTFLILIIGEKKIYNLIKKSE